MKRNELVILVVLLILATLWPLFCNWYDNEYGDRKYEQAARSRPVVYGHYEPLLLSHRLVEFDRVSGIASTGRASLAFGNTQAWFSDVRKQCIKSLSNQDYLACANQLLGRHFFYSPAQAVSDGWADHYSDCDLNVYLLMDAMHMAGREADILYAPHHAFISYRDEITREWLYWETTGKHNTGSIADLRLDLYRKTPSHFYYTPEPAAHAESIYPALVINKITPADKRHDLLITLHQHYPDNPFVQDAWYEQKSVITREDAQLLLSLIKTDITSVSKRLLLVGYFLNQNEENKAKQVLSEILDEDCNGACLRLKSQQSVSYRFALWGLNQLKDLNIRISLRDFFASIIESGYYYLGIISLFAIHKIMTIWSLTISRKRSHPEPQHQDNNAG